MKKVLSIIAVYIFFCLGACIAWAFCSDASLPALLPHTITTYKVCTALEVFCALLPAILMAGFCASFAIAFGQGDQEKCRDRFSPDMFDKYKLVTVVSLICVAVLTAATEMGEPLVANYKRQLEQQEGLARDYEKNSGNMYRAGSFELSYQYAKLALELDPESEVARRLLNDANISREAHGMALKEEAKHKIPKAKTSEEGYTVPELRGLAEKAYSNSNWFDAHYYAETAVNMAEERDTNVPFLKEIAAVAWNKLEAPSAPPQTEEERLYALKLSGYGALMRGDNLRAYYIFISLSRRSRKMAGDPDVVRYLTIAQERLEKAYFFIDETMGKEDFERANMVCFALKHADGTTDIIHIKGIVPVKGASGTVQYLRGFTMLSLDQSGNMRRRLYDQNVKMTSVSREDFNGILDLPAGADTVPYLLLKSVDRYDDKVMNTAECTFADEAGTMEADDVPDTLVLPMSCDDFELVKEASKGADTMDIIALIKIIRHADKYGYSSEVFAQVLLDRLLYPMLILCVLMLLASVAWNFRTKAGIPFQTAWILSFPIMTAGALLMMQVVLWLYRIMNHVFVWVAGLAASPIFALAIYVAIFIISSVIFLARNNIDTD